MGEGRAGEGIDSSESFSFAGETDSSEIRGASLCIVGGLFPYERFSACIEKISDCCFQLQPKQLNLYFWNTKSITRPKYSHSNGV